MEPGLHKPRSDTPNTTETETVLVSRSCTETVMILSPTGTVILAASQQNVVSQDQKIIIVLSALCFALLCVIVGLLVWYRRGSAQRIRHYGNRDSTGGGGTAIATRRSESRYTRGPSPLLVARAMSMTERDSTRLPTSATSTKFLFARSSPSPTGPVEETEMTPTKASSRKSPRKLTIDSSLPFQKNSRFGPDAPWTAAFVDGGQKAVPKEDLHRPPRATRAVSYPSESAAHFFPKTPDSAFPLADHAGDYYVPPSPVPSTHRRLHTLPELTSIVIVDPEGRHSTSGGSGAYAITPSPYATPLEYFPELPPSPPPSPATITSPSTNSQNSRTSAVRPPSSRSNSHRPQTASSVHLSMSSTSGSSARFSSLFFAPLGSSPPRHDPIAEAEGSDSLV